MSGFINLMMELKKCCNHAFLVRPPETEDTIMDRFEVMMISSHGLHMFLAASLFICCGAWWRIGRFGAFRPKGGRFESRSGRHVGTLGKPFTHSCLCASA